MEERPTSVRLLLALALSVVLHLSLICGVQIGARPPSPSYRIEARLIAPAPSKARRLLARASRPASSGPADMVRPPPPLAREPARTVPIPATSAETQATLTAARPGQEQRRPRLDVPSIVDPTWYEAQDLDLLPRPLSPVAPEYPAAAQAREINGEVMLALRIDEFGTVQEARVVMAEPPGYFEEAAVRALQSAHFAPAQRDGRPVRSLLAIRVRMGASPTPGPEQVTR